MATATDTPNWIFDFDRPYGSPPTVTIHHPDGRSLRFVIPDVGNMRTTLQMREDVDGVERLEVLFTEYADQVKEPPLILTPMAEI